MKEVMSIFMCLLVFAVLCVSYRLGQINKTLNTKTVKSEYIIERINVDERGLISVTYVHEQKRRALDYLSQEEFKAKFGIEITNNK